MANRRPDHNPSSNKSKGGLSYLRVKKESATEQAIAALRQVESEIQELQEKSGIVESELRNRDVRIEQLMSDLDSRDTRIESMEVVIGDAKTQILKEELAIAHDELDRLQVEMAGMQDLVSQNEDLWRKVQDLELFIEGRQDEWTEMNNRLLDYQNRLAGMEQDIRDREVEASAREKEKGDLAIRILELEGRCAQFEDASASLQETPDRRTKQVVQLDIEASRLESKLKNPDSGEIDDRDQINGCLVEIPAAEGKSIEIEHSPDRELFDPTEDTSDIVDVFGPSEDSIIDFGITEAFEDRDEAFGKLKVFPMPARQVLVAVYPGADESRRYLLSKAVTTIGRSRSSDICIPSKYVSRMHARIVQKDSKAIIENVGSTNGFLVNSGESNRHELRHGDRIKIGTEEFEFLDLPACQ